MLQRFNLRDRFEEEPGAALAELHRTLDTEGGENRIFALAELSYLHAARSGARQYYMAAAVYAYAFLFRGTDGPPPDALDPRTRLAAVLYNRALTEGLRRGADVAVAPGEHLLPFGRLEVELPGGAPAWAGRPLDEFLAASDIKVRGLRNRYRQVGLGAALVARLGALEGMEPFRYSLVPPHLKVPVTAFLRLDHVREGLATGQLQGKLELYSMDSASQVVVEGRPVPLEFEPSAALAYTLDHAPVWDSEIGAFLRGSFLQGGGALYTLTPYRPGRVPVVLVHGTASSPARWADLVNELEADPRIAPRIQLWFFTYNTGLPILYSGGLLREALTNTVAELDPQATDPAMRHMVLIGHSQGGLLAKMTVVDSGTKFWDNVSEMPFDELRVSDDSRVILRRSLFMTPLPFVDRVVFVATPHRGSDVAGFLVERLRWLVAWALTLPPSLIRDHGGGLGRQRGSALAPPAPPGPPAERGQHEPREPRHKDARQLAHCARRQGALDHRDQGGRHDRGHGGRRRQLPERPRGRGGVRADRAVGSFGAGEPRGDRGDPPDPAPAPRDCRAGCRAVTARRGLGAPVGHRPE